MLLWDEGRVFCLRIQLIVRTGYNLCMFKTLLFVSLIAFVVPSWAEPMSCSEKSDDQIEESQRRLKDFYQRQRESEGVQAEIDAGIPEVKAQRERERKEEAAALEEFLRTRTREVVDPRLEQEWLEQKKAEKEEEEMARRRFVINRDCAKKVESQKAKIPENQEYGIDTSWNDP